MSRVYIKFPKTGLGNMLLVWARGIVFARLNNLSYTTSSWWGLRWGALIRGEKKKRLYLGYFKETPLLKQWAMKLAYRLLPVVYDPPMTKVPAGDDPKNIYVFNKVITDNDVFGTLRDHQHLINKAIDELLTPGMKSSLAGFDSPVIGIHVRRGDFKLGNQTTPLEHFITAINQVRNIVGEDKPVTIFTDADQEELSKLLVLPHVSIADEKPDILDILLLSKSKIMILSGSSTFGYWAAFLSDAIVIRPYNDWQRMIKAKSDGSRYSEISWDCESATAGEQLTKELSMVKL